MKKGRKEGDYKGIPVYERLEPEECLILEKGKKGLTVACNKDGKILVKRVSYEKAKKSKEKLAEAA